MEFDNNNRIEELEAELEATKRERDDARSKEGELTKFNQLVQIAVDEGKFLDHRHVAAQVAAHVSRSAAGQLIGVDEALAYYEKSTPAQIRIQKPGYIPTN